MRLKALVLGLFLLSSAFSVFPAPSAEPLSAYSQNSYAVKWNWPYAGYMRDNYSTAGSCNNYPCFVSYHINETGNATADYLKMLSDQQNLTLDNRPEGIIYYQVRAGYFDKRGNDEIVLEVTDWSNKIWTNIDNTPPTVWVNSSKTAYNSGELVYIRANSSDAGSGVHKTTIYVDGQIKNYSVGGEVVYAGVFSAGSHNYFAESIDGVQLKGRDPVAGMYKYFDVRPPVSTALSCSDGTAYGECSATLPKYCSAGTLVDNCSGCGCSAGQNCSQTGACFIPSATACPDGTAYGQCSLTLPKYCTSAGALVDDCSACGCSPDKWCNETINVCFSLPQHVCGNSICEFGESSSCCRDCGCPGGTLCNLTTDACFTPEAPPGYIELKLISPEKGNMTFSPGQNIKFILQVTDDSKRTVSDAVVVLYAYSADYTSTNLGNGLCEVYYQIDPHARESFPISFTARRQNQTSQSLLLVIGTSSILSMALISPQQDQGVSESQPIEVRIEYPNGDLVATGSFIALIGDRSFELNATGNVYRAVLNFSGESYGAKNISFSGEDSYGNQLDRMVVLNYIERKDYTIYLVGLLAIAGGFGLSYFAYDWGSGIRKDYQALRKEKAYLEVMDKRTHLEFFKRHIDENMFKKLALEYQQKLKDVDSIMVELEKRHRWLKWL